MLKKLKQHNISIIVSTPYLEEASLCDRVALMNNGKVLDLNSPEEIVKSFSKTLSVIKTNNNYKAIQLLRKDLSDVQIYPSKENIHITHKLPIDKTRIQGLLTKNGFSEVSFKNSEPDIEDCFMDLMLKHNS